MRPGVNVTVIDTTPPRSQPEGVDPFFVVGLAEKGPTAPVLIRDMSSFEDNFGTRQSYGDLYQFVDAYLREGGTRAYVSRVVGPSAVKASLTLQDETPADTVIVRAKSAGDWGDSLNIAVTGDPATGIRLVVSLDSGEILETSPQFETRADLIGYTGSSYIEVAATGTSVLLPDVLSATNLTGGDDDRDAVVDATYVAALAGFTKALGSGQIAAPGKTSVTIQQALLNHAEEFNRIALLDAPDSDTASTLVSAAQTLHAEDNARYGAMFGPKAIIPGVVPGTTQEMPWTVLEAAMMARLQNPNDPAAGEKGESRLALSAKYEYTDAEREDLNAAGVNIARPLYGAVRTYGYRSLVDPEDYPQWVQFSAARTVMAIKAEADIIGERHMFKKIDGRGVEFSQLNAELSAMLAGYYAQDALYGNTPDEAYLVDTGASVNTPTTIMDGQIRATLRVRTSPFGEMVNIDIIKTPLPSTVGPASLATA